MTFGNLKPGDYGITPTTNNPLAWELACFERGGTLLDLENRPNPKGKPKAYHFWMAVNMIWNYPGSKCRVDMHPWALRMVEHLCKHNYLGIAGCASSGKSRILAIWGIVNFLCAANRTKVFITSTSLKDSKGRIWGDVEELWQHMVASGPGTLVSSSGLIRYENPVTGEKSDKCGLQLIAGEQSKASESVGKLIGYKAQRMFLIADELPELSDTLMKAAQGNLSSNPYFQMVGLGNPNSYYDPFGVFCEPEKGWTSISERDYEWRGRKAYVIRFDAEKSPNFGPEGEKYPYLMTYARLAEKKRDLGENSLSYYRMVKGYWFSATGKDAIYSAIGLQTNHAHDKATFKSGYKLVAGFDPAFTHGGDDAVLTIGKVGEGVDGLTLVERIDTLVLHDNANDQTKTRNEQIAEQVVAKCRSLGIKPEDLAVDATGGGTPFCDLLARVWGTNSFMRIMFSGKADDDEKYYNKVSEIWFSGQALVRDGQLRGIDNDLAREMIARTYCEKGKRIAISPKEEMKSIIGHSPDRADSYFLMLWVAQRKYKLKSTEGAVTKGTTKKMTSMFRKLADVYAG